MDVYEKPTGKSVWLLGLVALRELLASRQFTPTPAPAGADQWCGLSQTVAAMYTSDGGRAHRSCLDVTRGAALPGAAVATTHGGVRTPW